MQVPAEVEPVYLCNVGCDNRRFSTEVERQRHFDTTGHGVRNLIVKIEGAFPGTVEVEPSQAVRQLLAEREGNPAAEKIREGLNLWKSKGALTREIVERAIQKLLDIPANREEKVDA